jgi:outer membrane protein assembly factor BamB
MGAGGSLHAFDAEEGTGLRTIDLADAIGPLVRDGEALFLVTAHPEKSILSMDAKTLAVLWSRSAPIAVPASDNSLRTSEGKLYLSGERIAAYDAMDGEVLWETDGGGPYGQALLLNGSLYAREVGPKLTVLDAANGAWKGALRVQANDPFGCLSLRNPGASDGLLIVPFGDERLMAYRPGG